VVASLHAMTADVRAQVDASRRLIAESHDLLRGSRLSIARSAGNDGK
jgi:hypothetical protein